MSKNFGQKLLVDEDFFLENDFYKQHTNFNSALDFYHALGVFTFDDKNRMYKIPNIDKLISENSSFKNYYEFLDALLEFAEKSLPNIFQD